MKHEVPKSIEAEETLLGNMILYPESLKLAIDEQVTIDDFFLDKHRTIFQIIISMYENKEKVDIISLSQKMKDFELLDKIGGMEYLLSLADSTISAVNSKSYINILKNKAISRKLIRIGEDIKDNAYDSALDIDEVLLDIEKNVLNVTRSRTNSDYIESQEMFEQTLDVMKKNSEKSSKLTGIRTLYSDLDNITLGFQNGNLIILAARPSVGKTALALNFAINCAAVNPGAIGIFSLEQSVEEISMRMIAIRSNVDMQKIKTGKMSDEEWSSVFEAVNSLKKYKFCVDSSSQPRINDIVAKVRKMTIDNNLSLVIIDYLQLIQSSEKREIRSLEVAEISRSLKAMAREFNIPVIALSQVSRKVEDRDNKKPNLSDLRESGAIEQDADVVMFLHRDKYFEDKEDNPGNREDAQLIIAKHRNGPTGIIDLKFDPKYTKFYGISHVKDDN